MALRRTRTGERIPGEHPGAIGDASRRCQRLLPTDRHAPQAAVDRVRRTERRHGKVPLLQVVELFLTLEGPVPHRSQNLEVGGQRPQCDLEPDLVVPRGSAAVGDHVRAQLAGHASHGLSLHDALGANTQRIELAATHIAHDEKTQHLLKVVGTCVNLMMLDSPQRA